MVCFLFSVKNDVIVNLVLASSLILANIIISVALRHMRQVKRTTIVFLAHLAVCNLVQGVAFMANGLLGYYDSFTEFACLSWVVFAVTPSGGYVTGIFYVYLDLYLSLKKMAIGRPIISTRIAVGMSLLSWMFWLGFCSIGFAMANDAYVFDEFEGCSLMVGAVKKEFILNIAIALVAILVAILALHVLTYRLITKSQKQLIQVQNVNDNTDDATKRRQAQIETISDEAQLARRQELKKTSKWVKKNDVVLKTITLIFILLAISWYPVVITSVVVVYCEPCAAIVTKEVIYFTYVLVAIQYNSNGVIYLIKIKEFQHIVRNFCCRCRPSARRVEPLESSIV